MSRYAETDSQRYLWHLQQLRRKKRARRREAEIDADAAAYIAAVQTADGQPLEPAIVAAYDQFVRGCKDDGVWDAIKASCIMAGARTLLGALVPLKGATPTNFNFVPTDYDRKLGLQSDGTTKYLNSNRNNNADPQNSQHMTVLNTSTTTSGGGNLGFIGSGVNPDGGSSIFRTSSNGIGFRSRNARANDNDSINGNVSAFIGVNRASADAYNYRFGTVTGTFSQDSQTPNNAKISVFGRDMAANIDARLSFYSIGESLDLAALDARVTALMTAIDGALS